MLGLPTPGSDEAHGATDAYAALLAGFRARHEGPPPPSAPAAAARVLRAIA